MRAIIGKMAMFTIQQKLWGGFAVVLIILTVVVTSTLSSLSDTREKVDTMTADIQPTLIASMHLMNTLQEASTALGFFLLTREEKREQEYTASLNNIDSALAALKATPVVKLNDANGALIKSIESDIKAFKKYKDRMVELTKSVNANFLAVNYAAENMNPINSEFFQVISNMLLSEDDQEATNKRKKLYKAITNLRYAWSNMTNNARIFLTFGSEEILQNINLYLENAKKLIEEIQNFDDLTFEEEDGVGKLEPMRAKWEQHLRQMVEIHHNDKARVDAYLLRTEIGPLLARVDNNLQSLLTQQQQAMENTGSALLSQASSTHQFMIMLLTIGLAAGFGVSWLITIMITTPLKDAAHAMNDIAKGEGDLTRRLDQTGRDEIAQLAGGFNEFIEKIQNIVRQVSESTQHMAKASEDMSHATATTSETTEQQQRETDQAATAVTQLSATAHEVAKNAELTADAAHNVNEQTNAGKRTVNKALDSIHSMGETIQTNAQVVEQLGTDISDITSIIDVIQGIAEQTNLLALNAAIEAARAGEQGRGFAVVADEVRTLATRTKQSTEDIQRKVEALQRLAQKVVDSILENRESAKTTMDLATEAGASLDNITTAVNSITDMMSQIASAAEEQSSVSEEVNRSITKINELAETTNKEVQAVSFSSMDLTQVTGTLRELVGNFKV